MNAAFLFVLALAALFLLWKTISLIDSFIYYWKLEKARADTASCAEDSKAARGTGSSA